HPHVFDKQDNGLTSDEVLNRWENIKADTSTRKKYYVLNGLPESMPALLKAYRIQEKVARFGFDWNDPLEIFDKIDEEKSEIMQAIREGDNEKLEEEMGDILFTIVNLCRHYRIVPEMALSATCEKFRKRFSTMEDYIRQDGLELGKLDIKRLDEYWERAKREKG
ncbi:MAG: MazG family protein, partial [candidate division Zixibacteria bacterium]|nr:MazG family protein [candidate division Zixibacteria bacterium]